MRKDILGAVVGFVIGSVISYLYCKKRFDEGCCVVEEESCDIDEQKIVESTDEVNPTDTFTRQKLRQECIDIAYDTEVMSYGEPSPRLYNKVVSKLYGSDKNKPSVITESQFSDEEEDYDKLTVLYYDDGVVTDDRDDIMTDVHDILGDNLTLFGYGSEDKDVLYIRNNKLKIDYEVLKQNTTYRSEK